MQKDSKKTKNIRPILKWVLNNILFIIATVIIIVSIFIKGSLFYFAVVSHRTEVMRVITEMQKVDEQKGDDGLNVKINSFNK